MTSVGVSFDMSLFRSIVQCYVLLTLLVCAVISLNPQTCHECVSRNTCHPPACSCCNDNMPLVSRNNTPQMVFFTFDDAITPPVANFYRELFDTNRTNPNGCPIKMTLFVSHANTVYSLVREFYKKGMEIGAHSVSHGHMNKKTFKMEAKKQKENIARKAGVPFSQIKGWRSPYLEPIGDEQPKSLNELDYSYDATLTISKKGLTKPPIPFTLDYGWPYDCKIKPCPYSRHNGFWEVPVISVMDHLDKFDCVYVDGCHTPPPNEDAAFKFLWDNFNTYYNGNRAPFGMNMHASWFYYPYRLKAMDRFIKVLTSLPDVYIVSISQVLEWLKKPTPLSNIHYFKPWGCKNPRITNHHQQARVNFIQRQKQRQQKQQHPQQRTTGQKQARVPFASGTLGHQQYRWLQRQRARPTFEARTQSSRFNAGKPVMSWQTALRHQVMRQMQHNRPSTTPRVLWNRRRNHSRRRTIIRPSAEERRRQKEKALKERQRQLQLANQKRLVMEQRKAEQRVIAEEKRIVERKRQDAVMHMEKENAMKQKAISKKKALRLVTTPAPSKHRVHAKKELHDLLRFAESKLVQSRLLFGVGKLHKTKSNRVLQPKQQLVNTKQSFIGRAPTAAHVMVKPTKKLKSKDFSSTKKEIIYQNLLHDSVQGAAGKNKQLRIVTAPKKHVPRKPEKVQSTLPPIQVATAGRFVDYNPVSTFSTNTKASPVKLSKTTHQQASSSSTPSFQVTSVKYSLPSSANLIETKTPKDTMTTPETIVDKTDMPPIKPAETCKQGVTCFLPDCQCFSKTAPRGMKPSEIPQIIYITMDGAVDFAAFSKMRYLFSRRRRNPNGCRVGGTIFVSPTGTSVRLLDRLHQDNVEIALQGIKSHAYTNGNTFSSDITKYKSMLSKAPSVSRNDIKGYRGLDFAPVNDNGMQILQNKSMYDSSLKSIPSVWPFTLDYGWKGTCKDGKCPTKRYPGVWEVPVIPLVNSKKKELCEYADSCKAQPSTKDNTFKYLFENFNKHYKSSRTPFGIHLRQTWFHWYYNHNLAGLSTFMDYVLLLKDVYIVSVSDMIDWVKNPTDLNHLKGFKPWHC